MCFSRPTFGLGSTSWPLPPHACTMLEAPIPAKGSDGSASEYAVFGKALLEGKVLDGFRPLQKYWIGKPGLMTRPNAEADKKVSALVDALRGAQIASRATLIAHLQRKQTGEYRARSLNCARSHNDGLLGTAAGEIFLLDALQRWVVQSKRSLVAEVWRVVCSQL